MNRFEYLGIFLLLCTITAFLAWSKVTSAKNEYDVFLQTAPINETVMSAGSMITLYSQNGDLTVEAGEGLLRKYSWEGESRSVTLLPRSNRLFGSYGAYFPGSGYHWEDVNGVRRAELNEGQQHFNTLGDALAWLDHPSQEHCKYNDEGLVVCVSKYLERALIKVSVWQILIGGAELYLPSEQAHLHFKSTLDFTDSNVWTIARGVKTRLYKGGRKPKLLPNSCNKCVQLKRSKILIF
ncbi:MAG: hypothetical protein KTR16_12275 [Acidiferrobacterales bacterium]|nr:hypothetical protein [Acidiferrobacterales bacterium]